MSDLELGVGGSGGGIGATQVPRMLPDDYFVLEYTKTYVHYCETSDTRFTRVGDTNVFTAPYAFIPWQFFAPYVNKSEATALAKFNTIQPLSINFKLHNLAMYETDENRTTGSFTAMMAIAKDNMEFPTLITENLNCPDVNDGWRFAETPIKSQMELPLARHVLHGSYDENHPQILRKQCDFLKTGDCWEANWNLHKSDAQIKFNLREQHILGINGVREPAWDYPSNLYAATACDTDKLSANQIQNMCLNQPCIKRHINTNFNIIGTQGILNHQANSGQMVIWNRPVPNIYLRLIHQLEGSSSTPIPTHARFLATYSLKLLVNKRSITGANGSIANDNGYFPVRFVDQFYPNTFQDDHLSNNAFPGVAEIEEPNEQLE